MTPSSTYASPRRRPLRLRRHLRDVCPTQTRRRRIFNLLTDPIRRFTGDLPRPRYVPSDLPDDVQYLRLDNQDVDVHHPDDRVQHDCLDVLLEQHAHLDHLEIDQRLALLTAQRVDIGHVADAQHEKQRVKLAQL